jgi:hypothetical protein
MLAIANIGKLKMVKDFPLPVHARQAMKLRQELVRCNTYGNQQHVISKTSCRIWMLPRLPKRRTNLPRKFQINAAG